MSQRRQRWMTLAFVTLAGLALAVTPLESKFQRAHKTCEVWPQTELLLSFFNLRHVLAFGVLAALAALSLERLPAATVWILVLCLSALIEVEQFYFVSGHCRVRDLLPNVLGVTLGVAVPRSIAILERRRARRGDRLRSSRD